MANGSALAIAIICCFCAATCSATVMGVDLGTDFIKITAPSGNAIDIALNEQSHRKSSAYVGFRQTDRYFGEDAKNFAARFPNNMVTGLNRLVGLAFNDTDAVSYITDTLHVPVQLTQNENRGTIDVIVGSGNDAVTYTSEELLGMLFTYIKSTAEKHIDGPIREAVVAVPHFFNSRQRQAIIDAAAIAGVRVVSLMASTVATANQYGTQNRGFGDNTKTIMIYDMGASKTEVGIFTFSPTTSRGRGKPKFAESMGTITTLAIVSDPTLGGRAFDACIAEGLEEEFTSKTKLPGVLEGKTVPQRKAIVSLMRAANKAKEVLSANKQAPVTVEGIAPDRDFSTVLFRKAMEERCTPLFERAVALADRAFAAAKIDKTTVSRFELMGGAVRIPKLVHDLGIAFGRVPDRTLNSDEAAALGAGLYGASKTGVYRVKGFLIRDALPNDVDFALSARPQFPDEVPTPRTIFKRAVLPTRKSINVNRTSNFLVKLFPAGATTPDVEYNISGIREALDAVGYFETGADSANNNSHSVRVELVASDSGLVSVENAEVTIKYAANVSKKVKVNKTEEEIAAEEAAAAATESSDSSTESSGSATTGSADSDETPSSPDESSEDVKVSDDKGKVEEPSKTSASTTSTKKSKDKKQAIKKYKFVKSWAMQTKTKTQRLKIRPRFGFPRPMSRSEAVASRDKLAELNAIDDLKRSTAAAKNDLETYLMWARGEGVLGNDEAVAAIKAADKEELSATLDASLTWLEDESTDSTTKEEYLERLSAAKLAVRKAIDGNNGSGSASAAAEAESVPSGASTDGNTDGESATSESQTSGTEDL